jgi:RNase P protein component
MITVARQSGKTVVRHRAWRLPADWVRQATATGRAESAFVVVQCEVLIGAKHNKYKGTLEISQIS